MNSSRVTRTFACSSRAMRSPFPAAGSRTLFQAYTGMQRDGERPILDQDWKEMMMVDYETGSTSSIPPTSVGETTFSDLPEASGLPIFKHWSSLERHH